MLCLVDTITALELNRMDRNLIQCQLSDMSSLGPETSSLKSKINKKDIINAYNFFYYCLCYIDCIIWKKRGVGGFCFFTEKIKISAFNFFSSQKYYFVDYYVMACYNC